MPYRADDKAVILEHVAALQAVAAPGRQRRGRRAACADALLRCGRPRQRTRVRGPRVARARAQAGRAPRTPRAAPAAWCPCPCRCSSASEASEEAQARAVTLCPSARQHARRQRAAASVRSGGSRRRVAAHLASADLPQHQLRWLERSRQRARSVKVLRAAGCSAARRRRIAAIAPWRRARRARGARAPRTARRAACEQTQPSCSVVRERSASGV